MEKDDFDEFDELECSELDRYTDNWYFAMLLIDGTVLGFATLLSEGKDFYKIELLQGSYIKHSFGKPIVYATLDDRTTCVVRKSAVVAIQEIANT